jgi:tight adherence protein B
VATRWWVLLPLVALAVAWAAPQVAGLVLTALGVAAGGLVLWRQRARRLTARAMAAEVVECCEQLASELAAGQAPAVVLDRVAGEWAWLGPVASAQVVGGDVPAALRVVAARPGAGALTIVAAAWEIAHRTGQGLASALDVVAQDLRAAQQTRLVVDGELASARSTAKLVAGLPVAALVMSSGVGGDPWAFLFGTPLGTGCLVVGLGLGFAGLVWIEAIAGSVER